MFFIYSMLCIIMSLSSFAPLILYVSAVCYYSLFLCSLCSILLLPSFLCRSLRSLLSYTASCLGFLDWHTSTSTATFLLHSDNKLQDLRIQHHSTKLSICQVSQPTSFVLRKFKEGETSKEGGGLINLFNIRSSWSYCKVAEATRILKSPSHHHPSYKVPFFFSPHSSREVRKPKEVTTMKEKSLYILI